MTGAMFTSPADAGRRLAGVRYLADEAIATCGWTEFAFRCTAVNSALKSESGSLGS